MKTDVSIPGHSGSIEVSDKDLSALERFLSFITPGFLKDSLGILDDNAKFMRWKNVLRIIKEAEKIRKKHNLKTTPLPLKPSVTFIDAASLEESPTLQKMWANLLANSSSGKVDSNVMFISILKELSTSDAKVLNKFYLIIKRRKSVQPIYPSLYKYSLTDSIESEEPNPEMILDNLVRLRLLKEPEKASTALPKSRRSSLGGGGGENSSPSLGTYYGQNGTIEEVMTYLKQDEKNAKAASSKLQLTPLGYSLVKACNISSKK